MEKDGSHNYKLEKPIQNISDKSQMPPLQIEKHNEHNGQQKTTNTTIVSGKDRHRDRH